MKPDTKRADTFEKEINKYDIAKIDEKINYYNYIIQTYISTSDNSYLENLKNKLDEMFDVNCIIYNKDNPHVYYIEVQFYSIH